MSKEIATDAAALRAWKARWTAVNDFQEAELLRLSPEERFNQFESLFGLVTMLDRASTLEAEEAAVRERWVKLRRVLRERT